MSKNIDEIFKEVRKVANTIALTKAGCVDCRFNNNDLCDDCAKEAFKALTEKKLVVPVSEEAIEKIIGDIHYDLLGTGTPNGKFHSKCAKAIYERQFKRDECQHQNRSMDGGCKDCADPSL